MNYLISILIPSYKRVDTLDYLLKTIPCDDEIEVILHSDNGPNWKEIEKICKNNLNRGINFNYQNNTETLGLDQNIISLLNAAKGDFVVFMGDDDYFLDNSLNELKETLNYCKDNNIKSILRAYKATYRNTEKLETYRYCKKNYIIEKGIDSASWIFKRSVSLAGVILHRESALNNYNFKLTGTLLMHAYLSCKASIHSNTFVMSSPFAVARDSWRDQDYTFGASVNESRFKPGNKISIDNSLAFVNAYKDVCEILGEEHLGLDYKIKLDLSKYSYPFLSVQRVNGIRNFIFYCQKLEKINLICLHRNYYIFKYLLLIFGEKLCSYCIRIIKSYKGLTPKL